MNPKTKITIGVSRELTEFQLRCLQEDLKDALAQTLKDKEYTLVVPAVPVLVRVDRPRRHSDAL